MTQFFHLPHPIPAPFPNPPLYLSQFAACHVSTLSIEKFGGLLWMGESPLCLPRFVLNYTSSIYEGGEEEEP